MTPAELIANLDAALLSAGETVTMRRFLAPTGLPRPKTDIAAVPVSVRALKADELVGAMDQTWSRVVLSPTSVAALLPIVKGDKIIIQGKERNVEFPRPFMVQGTLVRIELMVSG